MRRGDCISCAQIGTCKETSVDKALNDHTCPCYAPVHESIYLARMKMIDLYGERAAVETMIYMSRPPPNMKEGDADA